MADRFVCRVASSLALMLCACVGDMLNDCACLDPISTCCSLFICLFKFIYVGAVNYSTRASTCKRTYVT